MIKYILVKMQVDEIKAFPKVIEEMLSSGWSLAGSLCIVFIADMHYLIQPMTKDIVTQVEWIDGESKKRC